jgi:hypothetical protein
VEPKKVVKGKAKDGGSTVEEPKKATFRLVRWTGQKLVDTMVALIEKRANTSKRGPDWGCCLEECLTSRGEKLLYGLGIENVLVNEMLQNTCRQLGARGSDFREHAVAMAKLRDIHYIRDPTRGTLTPRDVPSEYKHPRAPVPYLLVDGQLDARYQALAQPGTNGKLDTKSITKFVESHLKPKAEVC